MSVLIRGMEMPKSCWECPMVSGYEIADKVRTRCSTVRCRLTNTKRPAGEAIAPDCPLVLVPPHGDLIDRDPFIEFIKTHWDSYDQWFVEQLEARPTIIQAEDGE